MRSWTADRFLRTAGLALTDAQRAAVRHIHDWRLLVPAYIGRSRPPADLTQVYCFGAAHGHTLSEIASAFRFQGLSLPTIHAFDSFEGLPDEEPRVDGSRRGNSRTRIASRL